MRTGWSDFRRTKVEKTKRKNEFRKWTVQIKLQNKKTEVKRVLLFLKIPIRIQFNVDYALEQYKIEYWVNINII